MRQKDVFLAGEGDRWFIRNHMKESLDFSNDTKFLIRQLSYLSPTGKSFLEVGCSNGVKSQSLSEALGWIGYGLDPSASAIADANSRIIPGNFCVGTADVLPFDDSTFDLVFLLSVFT